jgi:hypothetical protein
MKCSGHSFVSSCSYFFMIYLSHVRQVFTALQEHQLFIKKSKCVFGASLVPYRGHAISGADVAMDDQKVQAVLDWPVPRSTRDVHTFLGLAGYYRRFICNYGTITEPLTKLLQKGGFKWNADAEATFGDLERALTTTPVL